LRTFSVFAKEFIQRLLAVGNATISAETRAETGSVT
jgi:hypothetical protein